MRGVVDEAVAPSPESGGSELMKSRTSGPSGGGRCKEIRRAGFAGAVADRVGERLGPSRQAPTLRLKSGMQLISSVAFALYRLRTPRQPLLSRFYAIEFSPAKTGAAGRDYDRLQQL